MITVTVLAFVTVAAISLTQQVHTAQYVDAMPRNVSLVLAIQEFVEGKWEVGVDALEEAMMHVGTEL